MHRIYAYLAAWGLDGNTTVRNRLAQFSEGQADDFLVQYHNQALKQELIAPATSGAIDLYPDSVGNIDLYSLVCQLGIYADRIYMQDDLFALYNNWQGLNRVELTVRMPDRRERITWFLNQAADVIEWLLLIRPFVEAGIVYFTSNQKVIAQRDPSIVFNDNYYALLGFSGVPPTHSYPSLPPDILAYMENHIEVYSLQYDKDGTPKMLPIEQGSAGSAIAIKFDGERLFKLAHLTRKVEEERGLLEEPINIDLFNSWVEGIRRRYTAETVERLTADFQLAAAAGAKFVTDSQLSNDLALLGTADEARPQRSKVGSALLSLDLPYFDNATPESIVKARKNEAAFEDFRLALDKAFKELEGISDPTKLQEEIDLLKREFLKAPILKIDEKMKDLQRHLFYGSTWFVATLLTNIAAPAVGIPLFAAATLNAYKVLNDRKDELAQVKSMPSYFYWLAVRKK